MSNKAKVKKCTYKLQRKFKVILKNVCDEGIVEPVESSDWISLVVISIQSNRDLHLCVDTKSLNEAIWVDTFPLPNLQ